MNRVEYLIENWEIVGLSDNPYTPPECKSIRLRGKCRKRAEEVYYKIPPEIQGDIITTSPISQAKGRRITTKSGTVYILGTVNPNYVTYLETLGRYLDDENPIKIIEEY